MSHPETFDRYFERRIPEDALRKSQISALLNAADAGKDGAGQGFRNLVSQTDARSVISALDARTDEVNEDQAENLVGILFDEGDDLPSSSSQGFEMPESELAMALIQTLLRQHISSEQKRGSVLQRALESTSGLYLPARTVNEAARENQKRNEYREPLYDGDDLDEIVSLLAKKIGDAAENENLIEQRHLRGIFRIWCQHGFEDDALEWIKEKCTASSESFFQCLEAFNAASESDRKLYSQPEKAGDPFSLDAEYLDAIGVLSIFKEAKNQVDMPDDLRERQHRVIAELRNAHDAMN